MEYSVWFYKYCLVFFSPFELSTFYLFSCLISKIKTLDQMINWNGDRGLVSTLKEMLSWFHCVCRLVFFCFGGVYIHLSGMNTSMHNMLRKKFKLKCLFLHLLRLAFSINVAFLK